MELGRGRRAGLADGADRLALCHCRAALNVDLGQMAIGRHPAAGMADQDQVAEGGQFVAGIDHRTGVGGMNGRARRGGDIDAVIGLTRTGSPPNPSIVWPLTGLMKCGAPARRR